MSVSVNSVYHKVQALANKEQRGYITPQEFNLLADKAQKEIYEAYFHDRRTSARKNQTSPEPFDETSIIEKRLGRFLRHVRTENQEKYLTTIIGKASQFNLPSDLYLLLSVDIDGKLASYVSPYDLLAMNTSILKPSATLGNYVYHFEKRGGQTAIEHVDPETGALVLGRQTRDLVVYPAVKDINPDSVAEGGDYYNISSTDDNGESQYSRLSIRYYAKPTKPLWNFVIVNGKPLFSTLDSVDFDLDSAEEENLVNRILAMAGVALNKPDLSTQGQGMQSVKKQEENN